VTLKVDSGVVTNASGGGGGGRGGVGRRQDGHPMTTAIQLAFFNKIQAAFTQYVDLTEMPLGGAFGKGSGGNRPPPTLVLHAKAGAALGNLPPYEAFPLGGPFGVRGYSQGELGLAKRFAEAAMELRVPACRLPLMPANAPGALVAFVEGTTDLGQSARDLPGSPNEFFRKPGAGWTYGGGVRLLGAARIECAKDTLRDRWTLLVNFGERF